MITDSDITKLKEVFATKEELVGEVSSLHTEMQIGFEKVERRFEDADGKMDTMAAAIGRIENSLDGIAGAIPFP